MAVDHIKEGLAPVVASYLRKYGFSATLSAFLKENVTLGKSDERIDLEALYKAYASTLEIGTTRAKKKRKNSEDESSKRETDLIDSATVEEAQMQQTNKALKKSKKMKVAEIDTQDEQKKLVEKKGVEEATNVPNKVAKKSKKLKDIVNDMQDASEAKEKENLSKKSKFFEGAEQEQDQEVRKMGRKKKSKKETDNGIEEALTDGEKDPKWKSMKEMENELVAANVGGEMTRKSKKMKSKDEENDKKSESVVLEFSEGRCKKEKKAKNSKNEQSDCSLKQVENGSITFESGELPSKTVNTETYGVEQKEELKEKSKKNKSKKQKDNEDTPTDSEKVNGLKSGSEENSGKECDNIMQVKETSCNVTRNAKKKAGHNSTQETLQVDQKLSIKESDTSLVMGDGAEVQNGITKKKNQPSGALAFKRVVAEKVEFADPRLSDNSYWAKDGAEEGYGAKAQEVLGQVRGRGFRHEKTKKKRGSYRGGLIGLESHSIKFQNSDDDDDDNN